jgi:hypothetical protein
MSERVRNSAVAAALVAALAVVAELLLVDRDHLEGTIWGASVPGIWAFLGLTTVVALTLLVTVVGPLLRREHDYGGNEDSDG